MLPPYISDDVKSTGERRIFDLFKNDPKTKDWVILHSLGLSKHVKRLYGEIDFLVMAPSLGIFCLEVKSGDVIREEGIWKFTNRFGEVTTNTRGPFQQAQEAMFSLINSIRKQFGDSHHLCRLLYGFGVMFPHIVFKVEGIDIERQQIYDSDSQRLPISSYIEQLSKFTLEKVEHSKWFDISTSIPTKSDINQLITFLRGDFERLTDPKQLVDEIEQQINEWTAEQFMCLDQLQDNPRCLFQGAAGTGKTMLALESVRRGLFKKQRILMVCFNSLLGNWLELQLPSSRAGNQLVVGNFHQILAQISNIPNEVIQKTANKDEFFKYDLPLIALEAFDHSGIAQFDKLIIDEGQDLIRPEYLDVFDVLIRGGLTEGNWEIYSDFERQAIYSEFTPNEMLEMLESHASFVRFRLTINCRNTKPIGEEISFLSGFESSSFLVNKITGTPVEYFFYSNEGDQILKLENILLKLYQQKISPQKISILSPFRMHNSAVASIHNNFFKIVDISEHVQFPTPGAVSYSTIHGFKGLENSFIILTDIDRIDNDECKSLLYIGMSRAKVGLIILLDEKVRSKYNELLKTKIKERNTT